MITRSSQVSEVLGSLGAGVAAPFLDGFARWLEEARYALRSIRQSLRVAAHLGRWASRRHIDPPQIGEAALERFGRHLRSCRGPGPKGVFRESAAQARGFLRYLRQIGAVPPPSPGKQDPPLLVAFGQWLTRHRGVTEVTVGKYGLVIRELLSSLGDDPGRFDAQALRAFVVGKVNRPNGSNAKEVTTALRVFLRYLIAEGKCSSALGGAIPTVAKWNLSTLPRYLAATDVERLLASCDPSSPSGLRDRAVLLLLARLGLRAGDVASLKLDDIDWNDGSLLVSGKGRRETRLPMTQEVGDAVLAYWEHARPPVPVEQVFLRVTAPVGPSTRRTIGKIVARAIQRSGVVAPSHGSHLLRHSAATAMLRQGVSLQGIGAVLRHRSVETTAVYAKVDVALLRLVAQPWPEVTPC